VSRRILLIGPKAPPYGGVALQAALMRELLTRDGEAAVLAPSNPPLPAWCRFLERVPGARTLARFCVFCGRVWRLLPRVDVVHVLACSWLYFFLVVYPAVVMARMRGKGVVLNYRGGEAREFFRWFGWLARPVFRLAHVITAPSTFLTEILGARFGVTARIVPNILDFSLFRYRQRNAIQPKLLVARHLEKMYDIESVLRAFQAVRERYPEATLWIAGEGSEEARLRGLVEQWGLGGVRFLGHMAHGALPAVFDQCDVFVNASRVDNFPGALLEASGSGLPVVSTGAGGIPHIYENGVTALLVEPGDWRALAAAVLKVLDSPALAMKLTTRAAAVVRACEWKQVRVPLYQAYECALSEEKENVGKRGVRA
jgi:glycosyltransferase involved in cell wall biosynthesis